jgi:hypothetical protein
VEVAVFDLHLVAEATVCCGASCLIAEGAKDSQRTQRHSCSLQHYSYLKASVGCRLAALLAGRYPKNMPVTHETLNAMTTDTQEIGM